MEIYDYFSIVGTFCECIAAITAIAKWNKWKHTRWVYFSVYLIVIVLGELIGIYLGKNPNSFLSNQEFYSFFMNPLQYVFILTIFVLESPQKKIIKASIAIYLIALIADIFILRANKYVWGSFSDSIGDLLILICSLRYFYYLVFSDEILSFQFSLMFWFTVGVLLFYGLSLPLDGLRNILAKKFNAVFIVCWLISMTFSSLMYLFFSIGLIWSKQKYTSS